ncbi:MAG: CocE/NonD family hydrolase C-terminal non-catalytic domain-containing protein [Aquabacterium sp.]
MLVYTSLPLANDLRVAGPLKAHLVVSSSALDTDLVLRLVDVWPDGRATSIQEGALRLRYREGMAHPKLLTPDQPVEATVDMRSIAYKLRARPSPAPAGHEQQLPASGAQPQHGRAQQRRRNAHGRGREPHPSWRGRAVLP